MAVGWAYSMAAILMILLSFTGNASFLQWRYVLFASDVGKYFFFGAFYTVLLRVYLKTGSFRTKEDLRREIREEEEDNGKQI